LLLKYFPKNTSFENIFVPLCGKSLDINFLSKQCMSLYGLECSSDAILDFFKENNLSHHQSDNIYRSDNINLICDDIFKFDFSQNKVSKFDFIYDRAATVALPFELRAKYHKLLKRVLSSQGKIMIITFEIDRDKTIGPPFSVSHENIKENFKEYSIKKIYESEKQQSPAMGTLSKECIYLISK